MAITIPFICFNHHSFYIFSYPFKIPHYRFTRGYEIITFLPFDVPFLNRLTKIDTISISLLTKYNTYLVNGLKYVINIDSIISLHIYTASFNILSFMRGFNVSFITTSTLILNISLKKSSSSTNSNKSIVS